MEKKQRNQVDCLKEAAKAVVAAGLGINFELPNYVTGLLHRPRWMVETGLLVSLSGGIAQKLYNHEWSLGKDQETCEEVEALFKKLHPDDRDKAKFRDYFEQAAACVRHCETFIKAAALALEENPEMTPSELRRLARSFFEESAGRAETCYGCGGA